MTQTVKTLSSVLEYLYYCPICLRAQLEHYCRVPSLFNKGEFINYERCRSCGTAIRNPRMPPDQRLEKYEDKVLPPEEKELKPKSQVHYAYMMKWLDRLWPAGADRRLLDFGCGQGGFLLEARKAGFDVMGLELCRDLARHVESSYQIPVHQGLSSDADFQSERFNGIISSQVFEHLLDPRSSVRELRNLLVEPGILLIEVPTLVDIRERLRRGALMDDSHLFYFTPSSLSLLLREAGFRILKVEVGLRPHRFLKSVDGLPLGLLHGVERTMSLLQLKTGLSVVARLDDRQRGRDQPAASSAA